jgi:fumarate hydratase class I
MPAATAKTLTDAVVELIRRTSSDLPADVRKAVRRAKEQEKKGSAARNVFEAIEENVRIARRESTPICQDTGTNIYFIHHPPSVLQRDLEKAVLAATRRACKLNYLRPNAVDPVTETNSGDNTGDLQPFLHFEQWSKPSVRFDLMLKGGGCENVGIQYKLPDARLGAGRDLEGVRKCVIDAVQQAQGLGCAPGTIAAVVGGDRTGGYLRSKELFLRKIGSRNPVDVLDELEDRLHDELNKLKIGPMGFGGKTTVLDVFLGAAHRLPASYYVSVSYMCWAYRRRAMVWNDGEVRHV